MVKQGTDKYVPRRDRPWYGRLDDMSHQVQDAENERHEKATKGKGYLMEKYREQHERDFMQGHDCGKGDCPDHEKKPPQKDFRLVGLVALPPMLWVPLSNHGYMVMLAQ